MKKKKVHLLFLIGLLPAALLWNFAASVTFDSLEKSTSGPVELSILFTFFFPPIYAGTWISFIFYHLYCWLKNKKSKTTE